MKTSSIKKKAWTVFSEYIRKRDADRRGWTACVTCGRAGHWRQFDAGHFIPGRGNGILFDERGVHAQCKRCNARSGNPVPYYQYMEKRYGLEVINELQRQAVKPRQWEKGELEAIFEKYKKLSLARFFPEE